MSSWSVRVEVVTLYTMEVEADDEAEAMAIAENAAPHMLAKTYDEDDCTVTPLGAECDDEDDDGDCPSCQGSGGGEDAALRCSSCRGSGRADRDDDDREPEPREPREYGGSRDPE